MKIILTAIDQDLTDAWTKFCRDLDIVSIHHDNILDLASKEKRKKR